MSKFKITADKTAWPAWAQRAWEREWGAKSAIEPIAGQPLHYKFRNSRGDEVVLCCGEVASARMVA